MTEKLKIGYIRGSDVKGAFMESLLSFLMEDRKTRNLHEWPPIGIEGGFKDDNRSNVVYDFLTRSRAMWLLFIDTDMVFKTQHVYKLFDVAEQGNYQILAAQCFTYIRGEDGKPKLEPAWFDFRQGMRVPRMFTSGVQVIDAAGGACLLIHRQVLEAVGKANAKKPISQRFFGRDYMNMASGIELGGEDVSFCMRARACGYKTHGCGDVVFEHIRDRRENRATYDEQCRANPPASAEVEPCTMTL